jgi:D-serine deaminase-like pyridoxal phosphate-dependent protein
VTRFVTDAPTPALLVDRAAVERNTRRMSERMSALGVRLRPHVKTHKCVEAARIQIRGCFGGITVSTLAEARGFAAAGFGDITYAVPVAPQRLAEVMAIGAGIERLAVVVDHVVTVRAIEEAAAAHGVTRAGLAQARLRPPPGRGRSRWALEWPWRRALARSPQVDFRGVLTHAGQSYRARSRDEALAAAREERAVTLAFVERLAEAGIAVPEVSVGSTPTMTAAEDLEGITEIRPGNYLLFDAFQAAIGSCSLEDCAVTVLASVLGRYRDHLVIDAGALALSKDEGPRHVDPDAGFGCVLSADRSVVYPDLRVSSLSQEHGIVISRTGELPGELDVGDKLRVVANHSCLTAALHARFLVEEAGAVVEVWTPVRGW